MKFNEKLIKLRKQKGMSQEELGEKLNVTRQTVSKWELGDTTPEMEKLVEISKLFDISIDELTKEEEIAEKKEDTSYKMNEKSSDKETNWRAIIIIIALIVILGACVYYVTVGIMAKKVYDTATDNMGGFTSTFMNMVEKMQSKYQNDSVVQNDKYNEVLENMKSQYQNEVSKQEEEYNDSAEMINSIYDIASHNNAFENNYSGVSSGFLTDSALNNVISINQKSSKKIAVVYKSLNTQDATEIANIIKETDNSKDYLLTYEYDADGYICTMNISEN